ncbi:probable E3 ubiquitin-protein ligase RHB1A [Zingiber officinale]|uniref:probable E3 ubiquitin-protein ligase RHB1A n=1 Tax=Zingiber officinale TaxID=94328 RepID=UPI001C4B890E|nr:probable E3 ubiquitin-protein ligase RHB1A [Zingiber officinale]XP_042377802.1 probable E3 ubiquitin-protein ligase RHB1A [Zingiber officinale]XP_042377803.1 probable E3 ubiquitin-protein ligase RHB1A [Zingiber officinale]
MGGCCCCSSRSAESDSSPAYYYHPRNLEENEPLSVTNHGALPLVPSRVLNDNLATSTPDTYQAPPAPLPYDVGLENLPTLPGDVANCGTKVDENETLSSQTTVEKNDNFVTSGCNNKPDCEQKSPKISEDEISKLITSPEEEDACPICLEDYDTENPRILTKCEHHFHLSCILEWMERSDTCAICDQIMIIDNVYGMVSP